MPTRCARRAFDFGFHVAGALLLFVAVSGAEETRSYEQLRTAHKTHLLQAGPSPQPYEKLEVPRGVQKIEYPSGAMKLRGWLELPRDGRAAVPAIVFLHGGFAFSIEDYHQTKPFRDAGYAIMFPFLRGENGNPGNFELFYGEVDDAIAAVRWLGKQPQIRADWIAVFGHSAGGALAELTSLLNEPAIRLSGSAGSLYMPDIFQEWEFAPFDTTSQKEVTLRIFMANLGSMKRRHVAYLGDQEPQAALAELYRRLAAKESAPLSVSIVPGDHMSSVAGAMRLFLEELSKGSR